MKVGRQRAAASRQATVRLLPHLCGLEFSHGEARLQQWGNRDSDNAHVHAQCINGGVAHDHELHPKLSTHQDAVEAVARQRDCNTQADADSEVLLSLTAHYDQASTAAPADDDQSVFGREETLRLDEKIMDFQWFNTITWDNIKDLRGTTYVRPPPRLKFALQQAQDAILRAILHHGPSSPASESAWKVLVLSTWLLLGRPAVNASESTCAHFLEARLDLFWAEDWSALWAMVRAECDVPPVFSTSRKSAAEQKQSRDRKVATLTRSGERGRALVAARNAPPAPVTHQIVQEIISLYPADPDPAVRRAPNTLRRMPRLSEPGLLGMRAEHWHTSKLETATCLCKLLPTSQQPLSRTQFYSTSDLDKSHPSPNLRGDTDHSL